VRLIAPFDNILLSHADRSRIVRGDHRKRLFSGGVTASSPARCWWTALYVDLDSGVLDAVEVEGNRLLDRAFGVAEPVVTIKL
jgi:hypothetical protein